VPSSTDDASRLIDRRMALAREWDAVVGEIRSVDGFRDFLRPPKSADLLAAAAHGPVAVINISSVRCDALLLTADGVEVVPLPGLSAETVAARAAAYLKVLGSVQQATLKLHTSQRSADTNVVSRQGARDLAAATAACETAVADRDSALDALTRWLWDEIAAPVLAALELTGPPSGGRPWPRVWWCPTGPLTLLPLHAAGHHPKPGASRRIAPDSVLGVAVSSYTPTLRALLEARRGSALPEADPDDPAADRLLVVAVPQAPGAVPLTEVQREWRHLAELFPNRHTLLLDAAASRRGVLEHLPRHRWVHFSCHGTQNLADPSSGGVVLSDDTLTVADISSRQYRNDFAFLSACKTATGGSALPDEAITLAAAMHYTGYRHVIATLWSVLDSAAADIAESVYKHLTASGRFEPADSAYALHHAITDRRNRDDWPTSWWSPFAHTGP
jgi:CHAT domain